MLISNERIFNLPLSTTPQFQYGPLNPRVSWGDSPLVDMPAGSFYVQQVTAYDEEGDPSVTQGYLWIKSCESGECDGGNDISAWVLAGSSSIMGGTDPLNPGIEPWSVAQLGTIYIREQASNGTCGNLREIWIRVGTGTDSCDWFSIAETRAVGNVYGSLNITSTTTLTQTTDLGAIEWEDMDIAYAAASMSCDSVINPTLASWTLPYSGMYKVNVFATAAPTSGTPETDQLNVGFKYDGDYYTIGSGIFGPLYRAYAGGEFMFYGEAGNTVIPAIWTTAADIDCDALSSSIQYMGS